MTKIVHFFCAVFLMTCSLALNAATNNPRVVLQTNIGNIVIELFPREAPSTVKNFLEYVDSNFYSDTIFHRVVPGFIIQGGGMTADFSLKPTREPIKNEAGNGLKNEYQMVSMVNTGAQLKGAETISSQFFINLQTNPALNSNGKNTGHTVFGRVIEGMEIAEQIAAEPRGMYEQFPESPNTPIRIVKAERLENGKSTAELASKVSPRNLQSGSDTATSNTP